MKRIVLLMGLLLSLGMFCACSSDDEMGGVSEGDAKESVEVLEPIIDIEDYAEISDFFNLELPLNKYSNAFFVGSYEDAGYEVCKIINNWEEFCDIYSGEKELPEIDFSKYTLVIGYKVMPFLGYKPVKQKLELSTKDNSIFFNIFVENMYEYNPSQITPLYFWGLYPKMYVTNRNVNVVVL